MFADSEFGRQHFRKSGGQPGIVGPAGKILEAKHSDGTSSTNWRARWRGMMRHAVPQTTNIEHDHQYSHQDGDKCSDPACNNSPALIWLWCATSDSFQRHQKLASRLVAVRRLSVERLHYDALETGRDPVIDSARLRRLLMQDRTDHFSTLCLTKRPLACGHFI